MCLFAGRFSLWRLVLLASFSCGAGCGPWVPSPRLASVPELTGLRIELDRNVPFESGGGRARLGKIAADAR